MTWRYFKRKTEEASTRETSDSGNQIAEMEVNWSYNEEDFLYHRKVSFELEYPRTNCKWKTKKRWRRVVQEEAGTVGKGLERGHGNSWECSPLVLLREGPLFQNGGK